MNLFRPEVYQKDWINQQRKGLGNCDPALLEKSINDEAYFYMHEALKI
jgi:hypothetical protein